jgi:hypothetical protein
MIENHVIINVVVAAIKKRQYELKTVLFILLERKRNLNLSHL